MKRKPCSPPNSLERLAEIDAVIEELRRRQAAQPRGEAGFVRRARLALLIEAFLRTREKTEAAISEG